MGLLFEIGTEELPSWYVPEAKEALVLELSKRLGEAGLEFENIHGYATPRRIAAYVTGLAERSKVREVVRRGPAKAAAFDETGNLTKAALGFARSSGVAPEELFVEETDRGAYVFVTLRSGGEAAKAVLPDLLKNLVETFPAPRKMRWSDVETPFLRPIAWLLALLDETPLKVSAAGLESADTTRGHRFLYPGEVSIARPADYLPKLREAFVVADLGERRERTLEAAREAAAEKGLAVLSTPELLAEVTGLVEWPVGVLGGFDQHYLELPEAVLTTTMIHHQRYFPTRDALGKLAPYFVSISNNKVLDETIVRKGYEHVLEGRLADARFFYESDRRKSLAEHARALSGIGFHRGLGTMADKTARSGETARAIAKLVGLDEANTATLEEAAPFFLADLATQMVYELPELEGIMAAAYARAEGYPEAIAQALEHGARPKGPEAPLPESPAGAVLSVADRLDKLLGFFALGRRPSGSADPFGLRRDAIALARTLNAWGWPVALPELAKAAARAYESEAHPDQKVQAEVVDFIWDRAAGLLADEGIPTMTVRAARADNPPVITAARRCHLLRDLSERDEFTALLTVYKRAANLAREGEGGEARAELFETDYEMALYKALPQARAGIEALLARADEVLVPWDLGRGPAQALGGLELKGILALKGPLDAFLDHVLVMVEDPSIRRNRLALLTQVRDALRGLGALELLEGA